MIISDVQVVHARGLIELSAALSPRTLRKGPLGAWFRFPESMGRVPISGDPFLAGFLIPCMYAGEDLKIEAPVSPRLLHHASGIQSLFRDWFPEFHEIEVSAAPAAPRDASKAGGTGCCFSLGVDSWYSLLKHEKDISHLITIQGVGRKDWVGTFAARQKEAAGAVAQSLGKELLPVATNLRPLTDMSQMRIRKKGWGRDYPGLYFYGRCSHGSLLAAVGLSLQGMLSRVIIPSTFDYTSLHPWGSHPQLDPLWSTETVEFIHDGCEADRIGKLRDRISRSTLAIRSLRVCNTAFDPSAVSYNCCECEKCLRTMMQLRLCGVLNEATAFPRAIDLDKVRALKLTKGNRLFHQPILELAKARGDAELAAALEVALSRPPAKK